jgi:diacylglycerol kinase family enzyme
MGGLLFVNPRSGNGSPGVEELEHAARERGVEVHVVAEHDDLEDLARTRDAEALGMAGGDGSLARVAAVAIERDLPFVCVPFGTRNHFARDLGLDRNDPIGALQAFEGAEHRVDVGRVGERLFLNNVSLGLYARLVHHRERHRSRRIALARAQALLLGLRHRESTRFEIDGKTVTARVVLVANNAYELDVFNVGERARIDEGLLHLYVAEGVMPSTWEEQSGTRFTIDVPGHRVPAAVDGEPVELETPLEFGIESGALRVLLPPG